MAADTARRRLAIGSRGPQWVQPKDGCYAEIGRLDPAGQGSASYEIVPGTPVVLAPGLLRLTAANPSFMTGPGTNTYLLGAGDDVTVIDPGPDLPAHVAAILAHAPGRIRRIVATHTHLDHSPAAAPLQAATGADVIGLAAPPGRQDTTFRPDWQPGAHDRVPTALGPLRVLPTPGHASNHLCLLLEPARLLFTGDHIMQGASVVVSPPDGNIGQYLESLRALPLADIDWLAPAHGFLMDQPQRVVRTLLRHRRAREQAIVTALRAHGPATVDALVPVVYAHVPAVGLSAAARSLLAHLLHLAERDQAQEVDGCWSLRG